MLFSVSSQTIMFLLVSTRTVQSEFLKLGPEEIPIIKNYCGIAKYQQAPFKVVGPVAGENRFPWAAILTVIKDITIQYKDGTEVPYLNEVDLCSGTLISTRHVITAAHCFFNVIRKEDQDGHMTTSYTGRTDPLMYTVGLGGLTNFGQEHKVKTFIPNDLVLATEDPTKLEAEYGLDSAIVELIKNVTQEQMESGEIVPICMTSKSAHLPSEQLFTLAGFGLAEGEGDATLRFSSGVKETECGIPPIIPVQSPTCKCFMPIVSQHGDSGGGFYIYVSGSPGRDYLYAVNVAMNEYKNIQGTVEKNVMVGMGLIGTEVSGFIQHQIAWPFCGSA